MHDDDAEACFVVPLSSQQHGYRIPSLPLCDPCILLSSSSFAFPTRFLPAGMGVLFGVRFCVYAFLFEFLGSYCFVFSFSSRHVRVEATLRFVVTEIIPKVTPRNGFGLQLVRRWIVNEPSGMGVVVVVVVGVVMVLVMNNRHRRGRPWWSQKVAQEGQGQLFLCFGSVQGPRHLPTMTRRGGGRIRR